MTHHLLAGRARREARRSSRAPCRRAASVQVLSGILAARRVGRARAGRDRHGALAAHDAGRPGGGRGRGRRSRASCSSIWRGCCRRARSTLEHRAGRGRRPGRPPARTRPGCNTTAPRTSRGCRSLDAPLQAVDRAALLETVERVARSASRDESRPVLTGILVRFEGDKLVMAATDSYRLSVKETPLELGRPGARGDHPCARASASWRASRAARDTIELGVHENQVVFGAGDVVADDAPHRRPVPELQAAAAGDVRGRARRCRAPSCSTSSAAPR